MPDVLKKLSNDHLARLILRKLYQIHDLGGISMGRHMRNIFLEGAIHLMPLPTIPTLDMFGERELIEEANQRKAKRPRSLRHSEDIKKVSDRTIAVLLVRELRAWHTEDVKTHPFDFLSVEMGIVDAALRILPLPRNFERPLSWSNEDLIEESRERYSRRIRLESEREYKIRFGYPRGRY